jgi:DNA helicase HerA-like ATPase
LSEILPKRKLRLGITKTNSEGPAWLTYPDELYYHVAIVGQSGFGKSTFLLNVIRKIPDAKIILDPAGAISEKCLALFPDALYVTKKSPISLNPLTRDYLHISEIAEELVDVVNVSIQATTDNFKVSSKMGRILSHALEVMDRSHLDIEFLSDFLDSEQTRKDFFEKRTTPKYWREYDFKGMRREQTRMSGERISDRFSAFIKNPYMLRFISGKNELDLPKISEQGRTVIFNFQGFTPNLIAFIGQLVANQVRSYWTHQATEHSKPLFFFVDEYHQFLSEVYKNFLAEARKKNIGLIMAGHNFRLK